MRPNDIICCNYFTDRYNTAQYCSIHPFFIVAFGCWCYRAVYFTLCVLSRPPFFPQLGRHISHSHTFWSSVERVFLARQWPRCSAMAAGSSGSRQWMEPSWAGKLVNSDAATSDSWRWTKEKRRSRWKASLQPNTTQKKTHTLTLEARPSSPATSRWAPSM